MKEKRKLTWMMMAFLDAFTSTSFAPVMYKSLKSLFNSWLVASRSKRACSEEAFIQVKLTAFIRCLLSYIKIRLYSLSLCNEGVLQSPLNVSFPQSDPLRFGLVSDSFTQATSLSPATFFWQQVSTLQLWGDNWRVCTWATDSSKLSGSAPFSLAIFFLAEKDMLGHPLQSPADEHQLKASKSSVDQIERPSFMWFPFPRSSSLGDS